MKFGQLTDATFWRDVLRRAGRQAVQVVVPILVLASTTGGVKGVDIPAVLLAALSAGIVVLLRALTGLRVEDNASTLLQGVDRAVAAAAGSLLAVFTANGATMMNIDAPAVLTAAVSSAVLAVVAMFTNPPGLTPVEPLEEIAPDPVFPTGDAPEEGGESYGGTRRGETRPW